MLTLWYIMPTVVIIYDNYDCGKCGPKQYDFKGKYAKMKKIRFIKKAFYIPKKKIFFIRTIF